MCTHEKSTTPTTGRGATAMQHLYNLDAMLNCMKMAMAHLNEDSGRPEMCDLSHLMVMSIRELSNACEKLELSLRELPSTVHN